MKIKIDIIKAYTQHNHQALRSLYHETLKPHRIRNPHDTHEMMDAGRFIRSYTYMGMYFSIINKNKNINTHKSSVMKYFNILICLPGLVQILAL
ncbi:hypothetical protein ALC61_16210 [Citrobacter amalonaticus]|nr:hypothetical protein ALC61_16210 [Citrobacter amalonaticus]OUE59280.1 hypothetical protein AZ012_003556 [Citrobacter amalonaticus]